MTRNLSQLGPSYCLSSNPQLFVCVGMGEEASLTYVQNKKIFNTSSNSDVIHINDPSSQNHPLACKVQEWVTESWDRIVVAYYDQQIMNVDEGKSLIDVRLVYPQDQTVEALFTESFLNNMFPPVSREGYAIQYSNNPYVLNWTD